MGTKVKSKTEREFVLAVIAKLDRRGFSQHEIKRALPKEAGVSLSQPMICNYLRIIREEYKKTTAINRAELVAEKVQQYKELRAECWRAYELSMAPSKKRTSEYARKVKKEENGDLSQGGGKRSPRTFKGAQAGTIEDSLERIRLIIVREGRLPSNAYLQTIMQTLEAEARLLGLNEEVPQVNVNLFTKLEELLHPMEPSDPVEAELRAKGLVTPALPSSNGSHA